MRNLYIVIPVYDGWDTTRTCLDHLVSSIFKNFCVVLVDHSDKYDGKNLARDYMQKLDLVCIRGSADLWWTGATNTGIRWALEDGAKKIMLLNHDCYVEPDSVEILMDLQSELPNSILAPEQFDYLSQTLKCSTAYTAYFAGFPTVIPSFRTGRLHRNYAFIQTAMIVGGRGVIIPAKVFKNVGLLDEKDLPHYGSDNDFYMRCKSAGYKLYVSTKAKVLIDDRQTTLASGVESLTLKNFVLTLIDRRSHRNIKDQIQLFRKHFPVSGLYPIGVAMNLLRYFSIYLVLRLRYLLVSFIRQKY